MRMLRVLSAAAPAFLTNAHTQSIICTQLSAGKLTNENCKYCKINVNDNNCDDNSTKIHVLVKFTARTVFKSSIICAPSSFSSCVFDIGQGSRCLRMWCVISSFSEDWLENMTGTTVINGISIFTRNHTTYMRKFSYTPY